MKHTLGPWGVGSECGPFSIVSADCGEEDIAFVGAHMGENYLAEREANAHLISAAPELLAALKELEFVYATFNSKPFEFPDDHYHSRARAAIAKAEGGSK